MNWHVLAIMQSLISHRFLFIGNLGKSLKNWPSHLTTTGFFSTWLGVGEEYFHIFVHCWLVWKGWKQQRTTEDGDSALRRAGPPATLHVGTSQPRSKWEQYHVIRSFEVWSVADEIDAVEAEERGFCSQIRVGCESLWLAGSSWALLSHWQKQSFASLLS